MKKKLIYSILFVSLFLVSTASMVQPVQGYDVNIPKEAKGVEVEATLDVYDKSEWKKHLGAGVDRKGLKDGDSDVVGAKDKYKILEWEEDEDLIDYLHDFVFAPAGIPATIDGIDMLLGSMAANLTYYPDGLYGPLAWLANYTMDTVNTAYGGYGAVVGEAALSMGACGAFRTYAEFKESYSKKYDGLILEREKWKWTDEEFDEDPDIDDDEVPFFYDPRDWNDVATNLAGVENEVFVSVDNIQDHWADADGWFNSFVGVVAGTGAWATAYALANATIQAQLFNVQGMYGAVPLNLALLNMMGIPNDVLMGYGAPNYTIDYVMGLMGAGDLVFESMYQQFGAAIPDTAGFFLAQLIAGQPPASPGDDFMRKVIEEYDIDDEVLSDMYKFEYGKDLDLDGDISSIPVGAVSRFTDTDLGGETIYPQAYMDISSEGDVVTAEIEWPDNYIDPKDRTVMGGDNEDELEDFEIVFGDGNVWKDGDDIFWQTSTDEQIPGYEISILLGASAISVFALVYVIMKKRKK